MRVRGALGFMGIYVCQNSSNCKFSIATVNFIQIIPLKLWGKKSNEAEGTLWL
jgi:hypothetical protein